MNLSLEENKKIQIDHYQRSRHLPDEPARKADDKVSYQTLQGFLPDKKCKILDLGCGEARSYEYLSEHDYYGLDCCKEALEIAKGKVESPEHLKLGMIEDLPFEDEFFDVVWARHIFEHSSDMGKTLNEIIRVLKPDGLLIYALPQGKHNEPAHLYQTDRAGWFKLLSSKFGMLKDGEHRFNLNEYYGVCKKIPPKDEWAKFHEKALPYEEAIKQEPFKTLIDTIVSFVKQYQLESILETGFGTGYALIGLTQQLRGVAIEGIESSYKLLDRCLILIQKMDSSAVATIGDIFDSSIYKTEPQLIYHQGLLEHLSDDEIKQLLNLQTTNSFAVIFSVPSKFYGKQDFGDERLLTLEEWKKILKPFEIHQLRYYDDNRHILGILKGGSYEQ